MSGTAEHGYVFVEWALRFWDGALSRPMNRDEARAWVTDYNRLVQPGFRAHLVCRSSTPWRVVDPHTLEPL